ncbi:MAG: hypothetical protein JWO17_809 [Actinomycetia bacterium]|nr:hypothetical protein [Actinomycetes bacterium]
MRKSLIALAGALALLIGPQSAGATPRLTVGPIHIAAAAGIAPTAAPNNLMYWGGPTMHATSTTYAIFWEPPTLQSGALTAVSSTYNALISRYFQDVGGSALYNINTQYYDGTAHIANSSTFGGSWVDTSAYPASTCNDTATPGNCLNDAQFQAEVAKAIQTNGWTAGPDHVFFVYTSAGEGSCVGGTECAFTFYCAYHSHSTLNGQTVIYASQPYADSAPGCRVPSSPNNDIAADSTINVTSHEHMEAVTDPQLDAWYDLTQHENADKCAWDFGTPSLNGGTANVQWNTHYYLVQQEWNNTIGGCSLGGP